MSVSLNRGGWKVRRREVSGRRRIRRFPSEERVRQFKWRLRSPAAGA